MGGGGRIRPVLVTHRAEQTRPATCQVGSEKSDQTYAPPRETNSRCLHRRLFQRSRLLAGASGLAYRNSRLNGSRPRSIRVHGPRHCTHSGSNHSCAKGSNSFGSASIRGSGQIVPRLMLRPRSSTGVRFAVRVVKVKTVRSS